MGAAREDIAETASARSHVYGLLAGVFRAAPAAALVEHMRSPGFSEALSGLGPQGLEGVHPTAIGLERDHSAVRAGDRGAGRAGKPLPDRAPGQTQSRMGRSP